MKNIKPFSHHCLYLTGYSLFHRKPPARKQSSDLPVIEWNLAEALVTSPDLPLVSTDDPIRSTNLVRAFSRLGRLGPRLQSWRKDRWKQKWLAPSGTMMANEGSQDGPEWWLIITIDYGWLWLRKSDQQQQQQHRQQKIIITSTNTEYTTFRLNTPPQDWNG